MSCVVKGCHHTPRNHNGKFFSIPKVRRDETDLLVKRRALWLKRLNLSEKELRPRSRVCDEHFVSGFPSYERDITNRDWAPTLLLENQIQTVDDRFVRSVKYTKQRAQIIKRSKKIKKPTQTPQPQPQLPTTNKQQ